MRAESPDLPVWVGELYLEYHRGTYTTNGPIKRANRRNEQALRAAELWSVAAAKAFAWDGYPAAQLDEAWKLLLLNQFHDIIPGSSIHWANDDCLRDHARIEAITSEVITAAQLAMVERIAPSLGSRDAVVFNAASRTAARSSVSRRTTGPKLVPVSVPGLWLRDDRSRRGRAGRARRGRRGRRLRSFARERRCCASSGTTTVCSRRSSTRSTTAKCSRPERAATCSNCTRTTRKSSTRGTSTSTISTRGTDITDVSSIAVVERGPLRGAVQFVRELGHSTITQTMRLTSGSRRLEFVTEVDWHERHKFLKVAFPVNVHAARATYEIQFGHLERPTHVNTSWDVARFEVCAHRWADLSEPGYGVALLNDCKYGYDIHGNVMRLSLLRGRRAGPIRRATRARTTSRTRCSRTRAICAKPAWSRRPRRSTSRSSSCHRPRREGWSGYAPSLMSPRASRSCRPTVRT